VLRPTGSIRRTPGTDAGADVPPGSRRRRNRYRPPREVLGRQHPLVRLEGRGARPLYKLRVVAAVDADLAVVIRLLRSEQASVRGVALAERLVTDGVSPLYGNQISALREELSRVRAAL
jgi:hypothetical protein